MKKFLLIVLLVLIYTTPATAKDVTLSWDASPSEGVVGYKVYSSVESTQPFELVATVAGLTAQITGLPDEIGYYFAVTAVDNVGFESVYSNMVYSPGFAPPGPPVSLGGTTTVNNMDIPIGDYRQ